MPPGLEVGNGWRLHPFGQCDDRNESTRVDLNLGSSVELISIVPGSRENDQTVYLVADDFGKVGRAWRETDYEASDLETIVQDLLTGQYSNPIRVIAFNTV